MNDHTRAPGELRAEILRIVQRAPGLCFADIARYAACDRETVEYHVRRLGLRVTSPSKMGQKAVWPGIPPRAAIAPTTRWGRTPRAKLPVEPRILRKWAVRATE